MRPTAPGVSQHKHNIEPTHAQAKRCGCHIIAAEEHNMINHAIQTSAITADRVAVAKFTALLLTQSWPAT